MFRTEDDVCRQYHIIVWLRQHQVDNREFHDQNIREVQHRLHGQHAIAAERSDHHSCPHHQRLTVQFDGLNLTRLLYSEGMGGGGIAAIIIAICVVFSVAAVLVVMLKNRDWDVRRLVPPRLVQVVTPNNNNTTMASFGNISYNSNSGTVKTNQ